MQISNGNMFWLRRKVSWLFGERIRLAHYTVELYKMKPLDKQYTIMSKNIDFGNF